MFYLLKGSIEEAVRVIGKTGFERIEIFDGNLYSYINKKSQFNDLLKENKVKLTADYTPANFIFDEIFEEEFYKIDKPITAAKFFGANHLIMGGGAHSLFQILFLAPISLRGLQIEEITFSFYTKK